MFTQIKPAARRTSNTFLLASMTLHGIVLAWLLHEPTPQLLNPVSIAHGENGITKLYWPSRTPDDSASSSSDKATEVYRRQRLAHEKLMWKQTAAKAHSPARPLSPSQAEDQSKTQTLSARGHGAPAGLPYGTLAHGPAYGEEVRPALPVKTSDPVAYPWELPDSEGNVVVEITIDERGDIVDKTVLNSMGSKLDQKVLAALESWHFQPATRNGIAIPSKQDAIFHFRARG